MPPVHPSPTPLPFQMAHQFFCQFYLLNSFNISSLFYILTVTELKSSSPLPSCASVLSLPPSCPLQFLLSEERAVLLGNKPGPATRPRQTLQWLSTNLRGKLKP